MINLSILVTMWFILGSQKYNQKASSVCKATDIYSKFWLLVFLLLLFFLFNGSNKVINKTTRNLNIQ